MKREHNIETELPNDFKRLEHIVFTGTQYIDTMVNGGSAIDYSLEAYKNGSEDCTLFGDRYSISARRQTILFFEGKIYVNNGVNNDEYVESYSASTLYTFQKFGTSIDVNGVKYEFKRMTPFTTPSTLLIGAYRNNGTFTTVGNFNGYVTFCDIFENGEQIRRLIPALRISDNKPGLYDLCGSICPLTNTPFYVNAGTGEFLYR